jgi:GntR family transcriptional regulator
MTIADFLRPDRWLREGAGPRYVQLCRRLQDAIAQGVLVANASLPPEREITAITGLSRVTVRKALQDLAGRGVIVQRQGSGSFVREPAARAEQVLLEVTSFDGEGADRATDTGSTWLERGIMRASGREVEALGLHPGASVARICRLRFAEGRPLALERASLPLRILPDPLKVDGSLYDVLARDGHRPVRAVQRFCALNLGGEEAELLKVPRGSAALSIERTSYLESSEVVEFTRLIYRGDAYDFVAELRLSRP